MICRQTGVKLFRLVSTVCKNMEKLEVVPDVIDTAPAAKLEVGHKLQRYFKIQLH